MLIHVIILILMISNFASAEYVTPAVDFFMYGRSYDMQLRDYFRFEEPKPLRIEYFYINWLESQSGSGEFRDRLHIETMVPIYKGEKLLVDIPIEFSRIPTWAEKENYSFGDNISNLETDLIVRWNLKNKLKFMLGGEYKLKGGSEIFGKSSGMTISPIKLISSYDISKRINFAIGIRLDKYYYDTDEESESFKLSNRLYYYPISMINLHTGEKITLMLGYPDSGVSLSFIDMIKAEARISINQEIQCAIRLRPINRTNISLRYLKIPYKEIPVRPLVSPYDEPIADRVSFNSNVFSFEIGRELNPAALASIGFSYFPDFDVNFKNDHRDVITLNGKSNYVLGITFTVDFATLFQIR